jgi:GDPmannose 4,6-dehydratase
VELAFRCVDIEIAWSGEGSSEVGRDGASGKILVAVDPEYYRPTEVDLLLGDPSKAHRVLGWRHSTRFPELVKEMVASDLKQASFPPIH